MEKKFALRTKGIQKSYTHPVLVPILQGIDLEVSYGESIAIMGRSGEGKSTLLHILGTLEQPNQGVLWIADQEVSTFNKSSIRNRHIGFIFQSFHLLDDFTALENVLMPARIGRLSISRHSAIYQRAEDLLDFVGLKDRKNFFTKLLSGGEKQRVSIARALCNNPDIILADEPTGNLDQPTAEGIHSLLISFAKEQKKTLIVVTHNEELAALCDRRYFLSKGFLT